MLVLFVPMVSGAEFAFTSEQALQETCPTMFTVYEFTVTNTGDAIDTYTVSKSGSAAPWAIISPPGFVLQPGASQTLYVYVTPSKSAQTGDYTLDLTVSANKGGTVSNSAALTVGDCHKLSLTSDKDTEEICTGSITDYSVTVTNDGQWSENLRLSLAGSAAPWSSISEEFLRLEKGESRTVSVFVNPIANEVGNFDVSVTARSLDSNAIADKNLNLNILGCFGLDLSVDENFYGFCENSEIRVPILIKNPGTAINSYSLTIDGPEWVSLEKTNINLNSEQESIVNVVLYPGYGIRGNYPIRVSAVSDNGNKNDAVDITANVLQCHDVKLTISDKEDSICPQTTKEYNIGIMNTGNSSERFGLRLNGPTWAELDTTFATLAPQESGDITLTVSPPTSVIPGQYAITVEAESQEASRVNDRDSILINIAPRNSCFGVRTTAERNQIKVAYGEGTLVPLVIENIGSETNTFTFDIAGDGAEFAQLNPSSITVKGNSADTTYLYVAVPDKTQKQVYMIVISARDESGVVSTSSTVYVHVTDETEHIPIPEPTPVEETEDESIWARITGWFAALRELTPEETDTPTEPEDPETPVEPEAPIEPETPAESETPETPEETDDTGITMPAMPSIDSIRAGAQMYWYWIVVVIVLILLGYAYTRISNTDQVTTFEDLEAIEPKKQSVWNRFSSWLEEDEEIELIDELETPKTRTPKTSARVKKVEEKDGVWQRFMNWLEEDEAPKARQTKLKEKPKTQAKSKDGAFTRFSKWLDEEEAPVKAKPVRKATPKKKPVAKPSKSEALRGHAKQSSARKKAPPKKKGGDKGGWDKFKDWLEEE